MPARGSAPNRLYYGDNLEVLRQHIATESVDLVYLDPPFNSNRSYNVLFKHKSGSEAQAQIEAFDDTWTWGHEAELEYATMIAGGAPLKVADALVAMRGLIGDNDLLAYLVMMTPRLVELHRVLKQTGSLYLHCDPTASHYLKIMLDAIFGPDRFVNEIVWKRSTAHSDGKQGSQHLGRLHDIILLYSKSTAYVFNTVSTAHDAKYLATKYRYVDPENGRRYRLDNLTGPGGAAKGNPEYEVMGITRHWRYSRERMDQLVSEGRVIQTKPGTVPQFKRYLDESAGVPLQDVWTDIDPINSQAAERLGYPTQKPVALLERLLSISSNAEDVVLDPFCGCGTTVDAAQKLGRRWLGIDITYLAIDLIDKRLRHTYTDAVAGSFEIEGIPRDVAGARALFERNPFDFERWAVSLVNGQPNEKQVGDRGIDGVARFPVDNKGAMGRVLISVKGGKTIGPQFARDLLGTVETQKAQLGILITLAEPTRGITDAVNHGGMYTHPANGQSFPRIQVITIEQLLAGKRLDLPPTVLPYIQAKQAVNAEATGSLFD